MKRSEVDDVLAEGVPPRASFAHGGDWVLHKVVEMLVCSDGPGRGSYDCSGVIWTRTFGNGLTHLFICNICRSRLFAKDAQ